MAHSFFATTLLAIACLSRATGASPAVFTRQANKAYEVWALDQSDSRDPANPGRQFGYGGYLHIINPANQKGSTDFSTSQIIDLSQETAALCFASTGANPVRPHMIDFSNDGRIGALAFVASGHVVHFDAATRKPVSCLRTSVGANGARQAHMASISDDNYTLVANQNGKRIERIRHDFAKGTYAWDGIVDLANCRTPSGAPCQDPTIRPDNAPICLMNPKKNSNAFITLRGGGMFVVDYKTMQIIAEYDRTVVAANGCGALEVGEDWVMIDSGGAAANGTFGYHVYRFPATGYSSRNGVNSPLPLTLQSTRDTSEKDPHSAIALKNRYVWVFDRAANTIQSFDFKQGKALGSIPLVTSLAADPTPDIADITPDEQTIFVTFRGAFPLSGDPHFSQGSTPAVGVIDIGNKDSGTLIQVLPMENIVGGVNRADPHGLKVRPLF
ncbi:hypothetical protein PhCBS80983_g01107 [Powellomyces hirtus]|uniref:Methanethiol oxidase n=1 Tax=Powellomyces hirtus TaxID=109895 RepID=A0A507ECJ7_9FUNG|nr:hypothetical protein PhCBS80983_g01107 [Powellomyces hirtus]